MEKSNTPKVVKGLAHSKLILVGEHAVVYGKPAIAVPFPLEVTAVIEDRDGEIVLECVHYSGSIDEAPEQLQGIAACIKETLKFLEKPLEGLLIKLKSEIPIGRGLGSSAAIAIAIVRGLFSFYKKPLAQNKLMDLVHGAEVYAHGNPSGIDMVASSSDFPIMFEKEKGAAPLLVHTPFHLAVADSGEASDTLSAVKGVKEKYRLEPINMKGTVERIGELAVLAKAALANGDIPSLGRLLNENHKSLQTMGVSNERLDELIDASKSEGALGAKLTGGGRGGCMIALASSVEHAELIAKKLLKAGAEKTWHFTIERNYEDLKGVCQ